MPALSPTDPSAAFRRVLLALLTFGLCGTVVELLLLGHYEDSWQFAPLFFIGCALVVIGAHLTIGGAGSVRLLQTVMLALIVVGLVGVVLHYRGNLEFQVEMDPTQSTWQLFTKAMRAKTPPALAPGVLVQFGLLGWLYTYRHPALRRRDPI